MGRGDAVSRCGCSRGGSGGVLVAGPGLDISGDGTPQRPRTIQIVPDPHVCDIAETCMSRALCRGLSYDGSCIGVDISADEGNQLGLEADGIYGSCDDVLLCGLTVDNIPTPVRGAVFGAGNATSSATFASSYEQAMAMGLTMSMAFPLRIQDGVWIYPQANPSSTLLSPSSPLTWRQVDSASARSIVVSDDAAYARPPVRGYSTLDEILRVTRGRQVVALTAPHQASIPAEGTVQELVDVVARYCDQRGVIIMGLTYTAADRAFLAAARSSGIETGLYLTSANDYTTHPPATIAAEGIKWVFVYQGSAITDDMIRAYVAAGLKVIMTRLRLRTELARADSLGVAGTLADHPGYVYGKLCTRTTDPWNWVNVDPNQVGASAIIRSGWVNEMGASLLASPWAGSPTPGWRFPDEANTRLTGATLLGWARPLNPTAYSLTWEQSWAQLDGARRNANNFGLIIACTDDALPISDDQRQGPATGNGRINGYVLAHAVGDPAAPASTFMEITKINRGTTAGPKVSATGTSNLPVEAWVRLRAVVDAGTITFQRLNADNSVAYQVVLTDSAYRGPYMWAWKNQGETPGGARFRTAYRNLTIT